MRGATLKNLFSGFKVGKNEVEVNLLQYVDDVVLWVSWISIMWWWSRVYWDVLNLLPTSRWIFPKVDLEGLGWINNVWKDLQSTWIVKFWNSHFYTWEFPTDANLRRKETYMGANNCKNQEETCYSKTQAPILCRLNLFDQLDIVLSTSLLHIIF